MKTHSFWDSIYIRFLLQLLLLAFIPITLVIAIFFYINKRDNADTKYQLNTSVTDSIIANINNNLESTTRTTQSLLSSSDLISFLNNQYSMEKDYKNYISSIQNYVQATINADPRSDIYIYMDNSSIPMGMDVFYHLSDISSEPPIADFINTNETERWFCESDFSTISNPYLFSTKDCFVYVRKAYDFRKNFLGLIVFSIPEKYFLSYQTEEESTVYAKGYNRTINLTGDTLSAKILTSIQDSKKSASQIDNYLVTWKNLKNFPITIITVSKTSNNLHFLAIFLTGLVFFALLAIFLCLRNLRLLVLQMNHCLSAMDDSINNNYTIRVPVSGNDEIANICKRINLLLTQAAELSRQNALKEASNKESRLIALQHQINPHFIYNTMEVFSSKMKLYGHYEESDCLVAFANIFRYNISTDDALIEIQKELGQLQNYLRIQKLRYPLLNFQNNMQEEIYQTLIPKFTFQPIIENAISHGITDSRHTLNITATAKKEQNSLLIMFKDDGVGIPADKLLQLNAALHSDSPSPVILSDGHSVGLKNVNARLELYFGKESRLTITSIPGKETCVFFSIPLMCNT